jgi:hypothetical protein
MYLVDACGQLSMAILDAFVFGFEMSRVSIGQPSEMKAIRAWIAIRHPEIGLSPLGSFFLQRAGSPEEAVRLLQGVIRDYESQT